ncbi:MAG: hypothetical protein M1826_007182 [Phylliscum demangeonii]|nr:MAG: hypothetical protein M1826_007182 [Phylliscum demangeonii]
MKHPFRRLGDWIGRHDGGASDEQHRAQRPPHAHPENGDDLPRSGLVHRLSRKVIPELPRPATFRRQLSERRERLMPHDRAALEPRTVSADRRRALSTASAAPPRVIAGPACASPFADPDVSGIAIEKPPSSTTVAARELAAKEVSSRETENHSDDDDPPPPFSAGDDYGDDYGFVEMDSVQLEEELNQRWILNLSMHFRDRSDREKFFVSFAETATCWRRLTISCDYRDAPPGSLERDLKGLRYQRDKSGRIYDAIRDSLPDIQFYDTVTNLKLQTTDGRLHIHVTQDVNEIIHYPTLSAVRHVVDAGDCPVYGESAVQFESHLSGYVYRVRIGAATLIRKDIPGPDAVDEFLYEIHALHALRHAPNVIRFQGLIVDDPDAAGPLIKGVLISFAAHGALLDLLYEEKGLLPWPRRLRWARQIVRGLADIHEAGYVQGDFTLANIVIDGADDARIIDINRRGCPVGWEPPEMAGLIANRAKVGMFIGVKSDLFQLGMVLWALACEEDEVETIARPLRFDHRPEVDDGRAPHLPPPWFQHLVMACLSERPQDRPAARELCTRFPSDVGAHDAAPTSASVSASASTLLPAMSAASDASHPSDAANDGLHPDFDDACADHIPLINVSLPPALDRHVHDIHLHGDDDDDDDDADANAFQHHHDHHHDDHHLRHDANHNPSHDESTSKEPPPSLRGGRRRSLGILTTTIGIRSASPGSTCLTSDAPRAANDAGVAAPLASSPDHEKDHHPSSSPPPPPPPIHHHHHHRDAPSAAPRTDSITESPVLIHNDQDNAGHGGVAAGNKLTSDNAKDPLLPAHPHPPAGIQPSAVADEEPPSISESPVLVDVLNIVVGGLRA